MSTKYHYNSNTNRFSVCKAEKNCPLGEVFHTHASNVQEARAHHEYYLKEQGETTFSKNERRVNSYVPVESLEPEQINSLSNYLVQDIQSFISKRTGKDKVLFESKNDSANFRKHFHNFIVDNEKLVTDYYNATNEILGSRKNRLGVKDFNATRATDEQRENYLRIENDYKKVHAKVVGNLSQHIAGKVGQKNSFILAYKGENVVEKKSDILITKNVEDVREQNKVSTEPLKDSPMVKPDVNYPVISENEKKALVNNILTNSTMDKKLEVLKNYVEAYSNDFKNTLNVDYENSSIQHIVKGNVPPTVVRKSIKEINTIVNSGEKVEWEDVLNTLEDNSAEYLVANDVKVDSIYNKRDNLESTNILTDEQILDPNFEIMDEEISIDEKFDL